MPGFSDYDRWKLRSDPQQEPRTFICGECMCEYVDGEELNCSIPDCPVIRSEPADEDFCDG